MSNPGSPGESQGSSSPSTLKPYLRRKKSSLGETKIAVLGMAGVGKSALCVRFLTKRFIGEYDQASENKYKCSTILDAESVTFELLDTRSNRPNRSTSDVAWTHKWLAAKVNIENIAIKIAGIDMSAAFDTINRETLLKILEDIVNEDEHRIIRFLLSNTIIDTKIIGATEKKPFFSNVGTPQGDSLSPVLFTIYLEHSLKENEDLGARDDVVRWADGFLMVYSVTSRKTFDVMPEAKRKLEEMKKAAHVPVVLVGNKADLAHARQVNQEEGARLAADMGCCFMEVSASEDVTRVVDAFHTLCKEIIDFKRRSRTFLDRVFGLKKS
ncbi:Ras-like protein Rab-6B [Elysia marginata]|uniref:small monomeric GTPase n=1 Tax=Elysia marginata TaxID=1093978 RepID=A0AAV4HFT8_9GAST|nr:Ras-like protein Rab-6B [Elysia marginata]